MTTKITYSRLFEKQIEKIPKSLQRKVWLWVFAVELRGLEEALKLKAYRNEALKGKRKGQFSIRLNRAYRLIYEIREKAIHIHILEVHKHEY